LTRPSQTDVAAFPPRANETILLVEDADPLREMIHEILETAGYTVLASADPEEALRQLGAPEVPIHLLLTDVVMPRMSGPELARNVRIVRHEIKVLFMSGYTDFDTKGCALPRRGMVRRD
jgi:CheY-like chemotaxis protein